MVLGASCSFGEDRNRNGLRGLADGETHPLLVDTEDDGLCDGPDRGSQSTDPNDTCDFGENLNGESIARAEYWADNLDRWAEQLVGPG